MTDNTDPTGFNPDADTLAPRELRVVLVCDVVESVLWMRQMVFIAYVGFSSLSALVASCFNAFCTGGGEIKALELNYPWL